VDTPSTSENPVRNRQSRQTSEAAQALPNADIQRLEAETVEPQERSLSEISKYKARTAVENSETDSGFVMADDTGLFVDELDGFPGTVSSLFEERVGNEKLLELIEDNRSASFRCSVALLDCEDRTVEVFTGSEEGELVAPRGEEGFGYDPMFVPEGSDTTWAEDKSQNEDSSHREEALQKMAAVLDLRA
jgi:Xanthosine triphosphate pyrophosphatase